jgi:hypothetical protein
MTGLGGRPPGVAVGPHVIWSFTCLAAPSERLSPCTRPPRALRCRCRELLAELAAVDTGRGRQASRNSDHGQRMVKGGSTRRSLRGDGSGCAGRIAGALRRRLGRHAGPRPDRRRLVQHPRSRSDRAPLRSRVERAIRARTRRGATHSRRAPGTTNRDRQRHPLHPGWDRSGDAQQRREGSSRHRRWPVACWSDDHQHPPLPPFSCFLPAWRVAEVWGELQE